MTTRLNRGLASLGVLGLGAGGVLVLGAATPAAAFTGTCPTTTPAATLVADYVCEVRFTTPGTTAFTVPSGVTKLSAVLVGAGGGAETDAGGDFQYAGGGGAVVYVDSVSGSTLSITVGAGGAPSTDVDDTQTPAQAGGDSTVGATTAGGGQGADNSQDGDLTSGFSGTGTGGTSGTTTAHEPGVCNDDQLLRNAGGAQTDAGEPCVPGAGYQVGQLPSLDAALWPASTLETASYGVGGGVSDATAPGTDPGAGGSLTVLDDVTTPAAGSNGLVILRFGLPRPTLAATGVDVNTAVPGLAVIALTGGAMLLGLARRRTRRA